MAIHICDTVSTRGLYWSIALPLVTVQCWPENTCCPAAVCLLYSVIWLESVIMMIIMIVANVTMI